VFFFGLGFAAGQGWMPNFVMAIGVIVANVPEGLIATVAVALSLTAKKLARKKVLVKNLEAVETLGSTSCILSDKTGTLTQNRMTVEHMWLDGSIRRALNMEKFGLSHHYDYNYKDPGFHALQESAVIGSDAYFNESVPESVYAKIPQDLPNRDAQRAVAEKEYKAEFAKIPFYERPTVGDATESAIIKFFQAIEDIRELRKKHPIVKNPDDGNDAKLPFNSTNKFTLRVVDYTRPESAYCVFLKGAPEIVVDKCSSIHIAGKDEPLNEEWQQKFKDTCTKFQKQGERVLAFAKLHLPISQYPAGTKFVCSSVEKMTFPIKGFSFLGLLALQDPPK
jgi:sodium/potassium-transporting ATPase subunit alpha